jgi:hypothetical protein
MPPGGLTTRVAEADNPTTARTALTSTTTSRATLMTLTLTFSPRAALMTLSLISAPHAAPTTPPVALLVALDSPLATQPVPHVLQASAVTVSPMVHPHSMQTRGAVSFRQPKLYIAATLSLSLFLKFVHVTLTNPHWWAAMEKEYVTLMSNGTWDLVLRRRDTNVVID